MTYIKWKDEVESYLNNIPPEEKGKIFSYFSEMYADKREAGESEEQIIEEFGAPYDVARRILEGSRESSAGNEQGGQGVSGGNNYNYNYYNYNYGGAPAQNTQPPTAPPPPRSEQPQPDSFGNGIKMPAPEKKKSAGAGRVVAAVFLTIGLIILTLATIGTSLSLIIGGFIDIGSAAGALAASKLGGSAGAVYIGNGMMFVGIGFILLAAFSSLCGFLWKKLTKFYKGA